MKNVILQVMLPWILYKTRQLRRQHKYTNLHQWQIHKGKQRHTLASKDCHGKILAPRWFKSVIIIHSSGQIQRPIPSHTHKLQTACTEIQAFKLEVNTFPLPLSQRTPCAENAAFKHPDAMNILYCKYTRILKVVFAKSSTTRTTDHA